MRGIDFDIQNISNLIYEVNKRAEIIFKNQVE